jgi:hypothetical protein
MTAVISQIPRLAADGCHSGWRSPACDAVQKTDQRRWSSLDRSGPPRPELLMRFGFTALGEVSPKSSGRGSDQDSRAIGGPLTPVKRVSRGHSRTPCPAGSGHVTGPDGTDSQADSFVRQPVQRLSRPVVHGLGHRVGSRGLQSSIRLGLELLQLLADLGLSPAGDLAPDPRTVRTPPERDRANPGAVRRISVDRTFAVPNGAQ